MRILSPVFAALLAACTSQTGGGDSTSQCSWPASLDPPADGGPWTWHVGHAYLICKDGPDTAACVSDDPTTCPGPNAVPGGTYTDCVNQCQSTEYAVSAGGPPQPLPDGGYANPPEPNLAACRSAGVTPAGLGFYCCPCQ